MKIAALGDIHGNHYALEDEMTANTGIPVVIMDANDIDQNQLGKCDTFPLTDDEIQDALKDNPCGQGDELTPIILIRPLGTEHLMLNHFLM